MQDVDMQLFWLVFTQLTTYCSQSHWFLQYVLLVGYYLCVSVEIVCNIFVCMEYPPFDKHLVCNQSTLHRILNPTMQCIRHDLPLPV